MVKIYRVGHEYSGAYHWIRSEKERAEALIEEDEVVGFIGRDKPVQERCRLFVLLYIAAKPYKRLVVLLGLFPLNLKRCCRFFNSVGPLMYDEKVGSIF